MDKGPLVVDQIDAGAEFLTRLQKYLPVKIAFWLKRSDTGRWYFYFASDKFNENNLEQGEEEVRRVSRGWWDPYLIWVPVSLLAVDDPLVRDVLQIQQLYSGKKPIRYDGYYLGDMSIDDCYIYPSPEPVPTPSVESSGS